VNVWLCPFTPLTAKTKAPSSNGSNLGLTYEEIYRKPDPVNYTWVPMTTMALWNYGGFADMLSPVKNKNPFVGPGLVGKTVYVGPKCNIIVGDVLLWDENATQWASGHPLRTSAKSPLFWQLNGPTGKLKDEVIALGTTYFNFGYLDGHVSRISTSEMIQQNDGRKQLYCLPPIEKWK